MNNLKLKIFLFLIIFSSIKVYSQTKENLPRPYYLSVQTGFMYDGYDAVGARLFFEYQKDLKNNWQYGVSLEQSKSFFTGGTDNPNSFPTNLTILCYNHYYKLKIYKDRVFLTSGLGAGVLNAYWKDNYKIGPTINASITLNVRLTKKVFLETSPLVVIMPFHRVYYSTINTAPFTNYYSITVFPIGLKIKL